MNRIFLASALGVAAIAVAAAPAVAGLAGNASFSHEVPVQVPSKARIAHPVDDHGRDASHHASPTSTAALSPEPGDDRGRHAEPGDDRGRSTEPGDDRNSASSDSPGVFSTGEPQPGDDHGAHSGHGGDKGH